MCGHGDDGVAGVMGVSQGTWVHSQHNEDGAKLEE